jgi:hypothetical protein
MADDERKALLTRIQRHNDEIARAAARRVLGTWERTLVSRSWPSTAADASTTRTSSSASTERVAEMVFDGFRRLGPVIGLSVLADEPRLIVDDMAWLRRAFDARNMAPKIPGWESELLRAYVAACSDFLQPAECSVVRDIVDRAAAELSRA